ncbi:MAG: PEGA domain-containing protein [Myxococcota bacterium]
MLTYATGLVLWLGATAGAQDADPEESSDAEASDETPTADPPNVEEARERMQRGMALLEREDFDAALAEFEAGYEIIGEHPARHLITFNIAKAHERMFRYDLALEYYQRYLTEAGPEGDRTAEVQATMSTLEGLLATLVIDVNVEATVWVDDREVGVVPGQIRVPGGRHVVELRADGYTSEQQEVQVSARAVETMTFELEALADEYSGITPTVFWTVGGIGVAAAAVGAVFGVLALTTRSDVDSQLDDPIGRLEGGELEDKRGQIQDLSLVADILFLGAVVFGVSATVLAFLTDWGGETEEQGNLQLTPAVGEVNGLVLQGAF